MTLQSPIQLQDQPQMNTEQIIKIFSDIVLFNFEYFLSGNAL